MSSKCDSRVTLPVSFIPALTTIIQDVSEGCFDVSCEKIVKIIMVSDRVPAVGICLESVSRWYVWLLTCSPQVNSNTITIRKGDVEHFHSAT